MALDSLYLSQEISIMAVKLRADRKRRQQAVAELRAICAATEAGFAISLQQAENRIVG